MPVSLIVAASTNNIIGREGRLPWHLPEDLRRFRRLTTGKPVIMGRATHESIGRALPERRNIVLTSKPELVADGCEVAQSPAAALRLAGAVDEIMVMGGARVYEAFLPDAECIYLTRVHAVLDGDTVFPRLDLRSWQIEVSGEFPVIDGRPYAFSFETLRRRPAGASAA